MKRKPGKKIDVWQLNINHTKVDVEIRMRVGEYKTDLVAYLPEEYRKFFWNEDINALRKEVVSYLTEHLQITWEKYFRVSFDGDSDINSSNDIVESKLDVEIFEIGTKPDGSKCHREYSEYGETSSYNGLPETGIGQGWNNTGQASLVPATPENTEALHKLLIAFKELNARVYQWLAPEVIEQNLLRTSGLLMLENKQKTKRMTP